MGTAAGATILDFPPVGELRKSREYSFTYTQPVPGGLVLIDAAVPAAVALGMLQVLKDYAAS